jgi:hypothetical protein
MISMSRYIKIVSGVGAGAAVAQRQLILRLITQNNVLPPGIVFESQNSDAVGAYFGMASEEYKRALAYFSFVSKQITSPPLISFARWVNQAIAPMVIGDTTPKVLSQFTAITAGTVTINSGGTAIPVGSVDFASATSLTQCASILQTAIRLETDPQLVTATVTFNTNTNQFNLTGSTTGSGTLTVTPTNASQDISALLGWGTGGTVYVSGQAADTADLAIAKSANISNNFGSFVYCTASPPMANADIEAVAAWNDGQNNLYQYQVATTLGNLQTLYQLVGGYSGTGLNILSTTAPNDYVEQCACEILAATNYNNVNAAQNYMFYQFPKRNQTVNDDNTADIVDQSRGNYIGVTQSAGQLLAFYQRGILCGGSQAAVDMNIYANEQWLKAVISAQFISLFLNVPRVPANPTGQAMMLAILQPIIDQAKVNGVISIGKVLTPVQQVFITQVTGDQNAWRQVQTLGYWVNITFSSYVNVNTELTEWQANYQLVYAKDDAIRFVNGSDIMI